MALRTLTTESCWPRSSPIYFHDALVVNLPALDSNGVSQSRTSVPLVQAGEAKLEQGISAPGCPIRSGRRPSTRQDPLEWHNLYIAGFSYMAGFRFR
jgi:hypothetical protein